MAILLNLVKYLIMYKSTKSSLLKYELLYGEINVIISNKVCNVYK